MPNLNPALTEQWKNLQEKILKENPQELEKELQKQITKKLAGYLATIPIFCLELNKYKRTDGEIPVIWQEGSSSLYSYSLSQKEKGNAGIAGSNNPILVIPPLINRHYILDLESGNSFVKYLSGQGLDTYLASWGEPNEDELGFSLDNYISRIIKMIDIIYKRTGQKVILTGYCMGGLLSLAAATGRVKNIKAIAFLATPWDFHANDFPRFRLSNENLQKAESIIGNYNKIPAALIQALFYYMHAHLIGHKFEIYPFINRQTNYKEDFLAIENWVNDGISMTKAVAKECFIAWVNDNDVAKLKWKIKGKTISPEIIGHLPAFFTIPQKDSIVPSSCAMPLTGYFNNCNIIQPNAGHVGMLVGAFAKSQTWEPFLEWIKKL